MADRFRLDQFISATINEGLAMTNQFHIMIHGTIPSKQPVNPGDIVVNGPARNSPVDKKIPFMAYNAEVPGFQIQTTQTRKYGIGPSFQYPMAPGNHEMTVTFYVDQDGVILQYFEDWIERIIARNEPVNPEYSTGTKYTVGYKSDFAKTMDILLFQRGLNTYAEYKLENVFPVQIGSPQLNWGDHDIMRLPVRFAYDNYSLETKKDDNARLTLKNILSNPRQVLEGVADAIPGVPRVIKQATGAQDIYNQVRSTVGIIRTNI